MLFLGSEKYPGEADYRNYVKDHGGMVNAYTAHNDTNYYFDVGVDGLEGTLDRFANVFIW